MWREATCPSFSRFVRVCWMHMSLVRRVVRQLKRATTQESEDRGSSADEDCVLVHIGKGRACKELAERRPLSLSSEMGLVIAAPRSPSINKGGLVCAWATDIRGCLSRARYWGARVNTLPALNTRIVTGRLRLDLPWLEDLA
jgi:hypothetical protein